MTLPEKLLKDYLRSTFSMEPTANELREISLAFFSGIESCFRATNAIIKEQGDNPDTLMARLKDFRDSNRQAAAELLQ